MFEGMIRHIFKEVVGHEFPPFERMEYSEAMDRFGIDKPDRRYDMELVDITDCSKGFDFKLFDDAEYVVGMTLKGLGEWSTKKIKELEKKATGQECGCTALVWMKINKDGSFDCSRMVDEENKGTREEGHRPRMWMHCSRLDEDQQRWLVRLLSNGRRRK